MSNKYPRYSMMIDGKLEWLPLGEAASAYDCGWVQVEFGPCVIDAEDLEPRLITDDDKRKISNLADEISGSK